MITYKNITEVEVVNEIPENATALINDGGELKQVACKEMGGSAGGGIFYVKFVYDPETYYPNQADKTFEEIYEASKTQMVVGIIEYDPDTDSRAAEYYRLHHISRIYGAHFMKETVALINSGVVGVEGIIQYDFIRINGYNEVSYSPFMPSKVFMQ